MGESSDAQQAPQGGVPARAVTPQERELAVSRLSLAFGRDMLTLDELEQRLAAVYRASTAAELAQLTADLEQSGSSGLPAQKLTSQQLMSPRVEAVLGNVERGGRIVVPMQLEIRSILGNVELDLRHAQFGPGVTEITVLALLGNIEVRLPPDMPVENHGSAVLGSFAARAPRGGVVAAPGQQSIRLTGHAVLGNVEFDSSGGS